MWKATFNCTGFPVFATPTPQHPPERREFLHESRRRRGLTAQTAFQQGLLVVAANDMQTKQGLGGFRLFEMLRHHRLRRKLGPPRHDRARLSYSLYVRLWILRTPNPATANTS